jgi:hypothetical protein
MLGLTECAIDKVGVKVKDIEGRLLRCVRVTLGHKFDDDLASELGSDAGNVLEGLRSEALTAVGMNIGALKLHGTFRSPNGSVVTVPHLLGIGAKAKASKSPDVEDPRIALEFECIFTSEAVAFFGRNFGAHILTSFSESQTAFDFTAEVKSTAQKAREIFQKTAEEMGADISIVAGGKKTVIARGKKHSEQPSP